jgi:hypothetical protein
MRGSSLQLFLAVAFILAMNDCESPPLEGPDYDRETVLQIGNSLPQSQLLAGPSNQLVANTRMGTGDAFSQGDLPHWDAILGELIDLGAKRVTTSLPEGEEPIDWDWPEDEFPQEYDHFIDGLNENGIVANYEIHFWDKAGHAMGESLSTPRFQTADQVNDFLEYVRLVVSHYKGRIQYYTLWSEPDNCGGSGIKCIEPNDYINLVRQTVPVIHDEDPMAKVSIAPVVLYFAREYLFTVLESDVMPMVDMIQWHGIFDMLPNSTFYGDYYYEYPTIVEEIRQTASSNGFNGEFWGTGITWTSEEFPDGHAPDHTWSQVKTDKEVAKYYSRSILMHLGMDVGMEHMGFANPDSPWRYPTTRNLYALTAGATPTSLTVNIENEPSNTSTVAFMLPNDDVLFALWTDGVAVEHDSGVTTTLSFPGLSAERVEGINVLYGFRQQLITSSEDGSTVIEDLVMRDYPVIIRFSSASSL